MKQIKTLFIILTVLFGVISLSAQVDLSRQQEYIVGGITVRGAKTTDVQAIKLFAGIKEGDEILVPSEVIPKAIENLWDQDLFSDVSIGIAEVRGKNIFLVIDVEERGRMQAMRFHGAVSKSEDEDLRDLIPLQKLKVVNENRKSRSELIIKNFYAKKGFLRTEVRVEESPSPLLEDHVLIDIHVKKGPKYKVNTITFEGNEAFADKKLKKALKKTKERKWYRIFKRSKYVEKEFEEDKKMILAKYNEKGYRNAKLLGDTIWDHDERSININIDVLEGSQFYFGDITWLGNTKYKTDLLSNRLGIRKGEVYNRVKLEERLFMSQNGDDVSSIYLDNGYLSFSANPVETRVYNDTIDVEVRVYEGKQYRINEIIIKGNSVTNDHVIRREIRTRPGDLFSRSAIIRTQRELSQLGYFDPAGFQINPIQNPAEGTVDIEYTVQEKPSDQVQLQGGWGAGRIVGTLGFSFSNFSMRKFFKGPWSPIPKGDGQKLSLQAQTNGQFFSAYSISFVEPWLGGRKPNSLSLSGSYSKQSNGAAKTITNSEGLTVTNPDRRQLEILGGSIGYGMRLQIPDDWFQFFATLSYQNYRLQNFGSIFTFANGRSNNLALTLNLSRDSRSGNPIFPSGGSKLSITTRLTPPFSVFDGVSDYSDQTDQEKFDWVEYHKWKFTTEWYTPLGARDEQENNRFVLFSKIGMGYLGNYNSQIGDSPFERFYLGGSALTGFQLDGREIIALRGYDDLSLSPETGATFINKYTMEMRYLLSPNPSATIYGLGFLEAGSTWDNFSDYDPFNVKRSGGVGLRIFLPMFGLMGLDYGWRFDDVDNRPQMPKGQFHFTIGMNLGEL